MPKAPFAETNCAKTILRSCSDALKSKSDYERAKIMSQLVFLAQLQNAPRKVVAKLKVAAGSVNEKRTVHIGDVITELTSKSRHG